MDVFHDAEDAVIRSSERDLGTLALAGYETRRELWTPSFRRAWVSKGAEGVKLEWCHDAAWRFFPIAADDLLGWRLHWFDAITNKALAMGSRAETRDLVDIVTYAGRCPLHAVIWAACTKDPGFGPLLLLDQMRRHSRVDLAELREMGASLDAPALKIRWIDLASTAEGELTRAGTLGVEVGLAFVHENGSVGWFDEPGVVAHRAHVGAEAAGHLVDGQAALRIGAERFRAFRLGLEPGSGGQGLIMRVLSPSDRARVSIVWAAG